MKKHLLRRTQCWHNTRFPRRPPPSHSMKKPKFCSRKDKGNMNSIV